MAPGAVVQLESYFRLLARWNPKINLTALPLHPPSAETFDRLLVEPLVAARYIADSPLIWFDLGSGGGSPAIPIKILRPQARLTMVESRTRKAAFLREAVRELGLANVRVENARFEQASTRWARTAEIVTLRAVRADAVLFSAVVKLLAEGGRLLWFGSEGNEPEPGCRFQQLETVRLTGKRGSILVVLRRMFHVEQTS